MTSSDLHSFSLVDQPWLLVRRIDGSLDELSLTDTIRQAHLLAGLAGELPTQVFALTRLVLAVLHRSVQGPRDVEHWTQLWAQEALPVDEVEAYLGRHRHRFNLFDDEAPFFQVAGLHTGKGEVSALTKLIADVPNGNPFLTMRVGRGTASMTAAEAARWVVHCQAFDPSGIKSGAVGDPRATGGRGYPIGVAWSGHLGGVLVEGATLRETLLLNLIAQDDPRYAEWTDTDVPAWERPPLGPAPESPDGRSVLGPLDLFTWQSRRIRLERTGADVTGVLICNGEKLTPRNQHNAEPCTPWRRSQNQEKTRGEALVYMPREHDPAKSVWRGLQALLPGTSGRQGADGQATLAPLVLEWLAQLQGAGAVPRDHLFRIRTVGMLYGPQSSTVAEVVDDSLSVRAVLLAEGAADLARTAVNGVEAAEACARAVGKLAGTLAEASGGEYPGPRDRAEELAYAELDGPFRAWVAALDHDSDALDSLELWHLEARRVARRLGRDLVEQAPPSAWSGRVGKSGLVTTAHAEMWFLRGLAAAAPVAAPSTITPVEQGAPA